jgi:hypothetical protein
MKCAEAVVLRAAALGRWEVLVCFCFTYVQNKSK